MDKTGSFMDSFALMDGFIDVDDYLEINDYLDSPCDDCNHNESYDCL